MRSSGPARRRGAGSWRGRRPAPRGPVHDQGLARHGGVVTTAGPSAGGIACRTGRDRRRPAKAAGGDRPGQDQHARVHLVRRDGQPRLRPDQQPVRPRSVARRQQRGAGGDRGRWRLALRHRQRHRRQHPPAGPRLRHRGPEADQRPRAADGPHAVVPGLLEGSRSSDRWRAGSRTSPCSCRSSPGRTARIRTSRRSPLGDPATVDCGLRIAWFTDNGIQTPTPETTGRRRGRGRALRDAGARVEERVPPGPGRGRRSCGSACRCRWQGLAPSPDGGRRDTEASGSFAGRRRLGHRPEPMPGAELTELVEARRRPARAAAALDRQGST